MPVATKTPRALSLVSVVQPPQRSPEYQAVEATHHATHHALNLLLVLFDKLFHSVLLCVAGFWKLPTTRYYKGERPSLFRKSFAAWPRCATSTSLARSFPRAREFELVLLHPHAAIAKCDTFGLEAQPLLESVVPRQADPAARAEHAMPRQAASF